jgi:aminopeptidase N
VANRTLLAALAAAFLAITAPALADAPFSFDTAFGRLPKNVKPLDYTIAIVPKLATHTFTGTETIALQVRSATPTIQFNTLNLTLGNVRFDGAPVAHVVTDNKAQLSTVTLRSAAAPGVHHLTLTYRGAIETSGPQGLFAQPYVTPDGKRGVALQTMFESTDARRMFPCWDEPAFRSTFQLTATVDASLATVSNMPVLARVINGSLATTTFARTPSMPAYLVEFSAADLGSIRATHNGTGFAVWALRGRETEGTYALASAEQILDDYNAYFGVKFPLPVLNSIAVPGGFDGGMENWGAIVYNDQSLLVTPSTPLLDRQGVYSIEAHEMAHQWNGDLVTMGWWDDLWLNESFASWMSAKETDLRNPTWHWWENQDGDKESAMRADAAINSHPIAVHITDELQAETAFDNEITYSKGQAFLRMLEAYLTPDVFRAGVRRYMAARKFSNATATDLWNALSVTSHHDVARLASTWIDKTGFPLVSVTATCDASGARTITFTQKRFLVEGGDPDATVWQIPVRIRSGIAGPVQRLLVTEPGQTARAGRCDEPLTVNDGAVGLYRVHYDAATLATNTAAFGHLPNADRIALLDDQWALASANQAPLASYLTLARSMGGDLNPRAWTQISESLGEIEADERGTSSYNTYVAFAIGVLQPVMGRLGWNDKPGEAADVQSLRRDVIEQLGNLGDPDVTAEAQRRFRRFLSDPKTLAPDDQRIVLGIVAHVADGATFERLHALAKNAKRESDKRRYLIALMGVGDDALAERALDIALSNEIPPQAEQLRVSLIRALAARHPALAWNGLKANTAKVIDPLGPYGGPFELAQYLPAAMWRAAPLDDIEAFIKARTPADLLPNLARGMESARHARDRQATLRAAVDAYLK